MFGVVEEERLRFVFVHPRQRLVAEGVRKVASLAVHVGVLGEAHVVGPDVEVEAPAGWAAGRAVAAASEVPHADQGRRIALAAQDVGDGLGAGRELVVAARRQHLHVGLAGRVAFVDHRVDAVARGVLSSQQAGSGRGAVRGAGVALREDRAGTGELIDVRRVDVAVADEAGVAPAHVVDQDEDDVRRTGGGEGGAEEQGEGEEAAHLKRCGVSPRRRARSCRGGRPSSRPWGGSNGRIRPWSAGARR